MSRDTTETTKLKFGHALVLQLSGHNFQAWKCLVPGYLQASDYAWEVVNGEIKEDDPDPKIKEHWVIGNRNARTTFLSIIDPILFMSEFYDDAATVKAAGIWSKIKKRFHNESGFYREQTINQSLTFEFDSSKTKVPRWYHGEVDIFSAPRKLDFSLSFSVQNCVWCREKEYPVSVECSGSNRTTSEYRYIDYGR